MNGGIPMSVPATTVNKVCLSGLNSIYLADLLIASGEAEIVVAGGMESMTKAPHLLPGARAGYRLGDGTLVDSMMYDGLYCQFDHCAMGQSTEQYNKQAGISRERQDAFAALSHERAAAAIKDGRFVDEIVPVSVPQRKGEPLLVDTDEGVRPGTDHRVARVVEACVRQARNRYGRQRQPDLRRRRGRGGRVQGRARRSSVPPLSARSLGYGQVAGPDASLLLQPANAARKALDESRGSTSRTSTCSRSTRRSPWSASRRWTTSGSPRTRRT